MVRTPSDFARSVKGPSIYYIVSKLVIFDSLSILVVILLCKIGNFFELLRRYSLWTAPNPISTGDYAHHIFSSPLQIFKPSAIPYEFHNDLRRDN